ncbi:MAG: hypothetical protein ABI432_07540 [Flavobacteriales bacterium]
MKYVLTTALSFTTITLFAQLKPVKEDLRKVVDLLPAPCTSIDDAYAKCHGEGGMNGCDGAKALAAFTARMHAISAGRMVTANGPNAAQEEMMRKMQDPAFQEQVKKMTPQQLQEMSKQLQGGTLPTSGSPTPDETAMIQEFERLNQTMMEFTTPFNTAWMNLLQALDADLKTVSDARAAAIKACPTTNSGGFTIIDKPCCAETDKKHDAQLRAAVEAWLPKANAHIARYRAAIADRYAEAERIMAALGYGEKVHIQMFLDALNTTQTFELGSLGSLGEMNQEIQQRACEARTEIDREAGCF